MTLFWPILAPTHTHVSFGDTGAHTPLPPPRPRFGKLDEQFGNASLRNKVHNIEIK